MLNFLLRRILWMIPSFFAVSVVAFTIIQLPPGDFVTSYAADLATSGSPAGAEQLQELRVRYGLDQPLPMQYLRWIGNALHGDLGVSFEYRAPVADLIWNRLGMTALVAFCTLLFVWLVAFPVGVFSALRQYSIGDYFVTFLCFLGMATPNFLLALFVMYISVVFLGYSAGCSRRNSSMPPGRRNGFSICCSTCGFRSWCSALPALQHSCASCAPISLTSSASPMSRPHAPRDWPRSP